MTEASPEVRPGRIKQSLDFLQKIKNLRSEKATRAEAVKVNLPVLSPEELANGWTAQTLKTYLESREKVQAAIVMFNPEFRPRVRPKWQNNHYNPRRWRG